MFDDGPDDFGLARPGDGDRLEAASGEMLDDAREVLGGPSLRVEGRRRVDEDESRAFIKSLRGEPARDTFVCFRRLCESRRGTVC